MPMTPCRYCHNQNPTPYILFDRGDAIAVLETAFCLACTFGKLSLKQDQPVRQDETVLQGETVRQDKPVRQDETALQGVTVRQDKPVRQYETVLQDEPVRWFFFRRYVL